MKNFTLKLSLLLSFLFAASPGMGQTVYQTVGIIGTATANGWATSTPLRLAVAGDVHKWTLTLALGQGEVKFRANDSWAVNWGGTAFPAGAGVLNGPNISVPASGTYTVQFDDVTGAYQFTQPNPMAFRASNSTSLSLSLTPNPTRETVSVTYTLPAAGIATIAVQNLLGQFVRQLIPVGQGAGLQKQQLSVQGLAAGAYLVRLQTGTQTQTARLLVE